MDAEDDVVVISDDEGRSNRQTNRTRHVGYHQNVYENYSYVPRPLQTDLNTVKPSKVTKPQDVQQIGIEEVVYVPDDSEEEDLLIAPIRTLCNEIKFGKDLRPPTTFPYECLEKLQIHLATKLRNVSSEDTIWSCVLDELMLIRMAYQEVCDVSFVIINAISTCKYLHRSFIFLYSS